MIFVNDRHKNNDLADIEKMRAKHFYFSVFGLQYRQLVYTQKAGKKYMTIFPTLHISVSC